MPDGSMIMDSLSVSEKDAKPTIRVPKGKFESPGNPLAENAGALDQYFEAFLSIPPRLDPNGRNKTGVKLANFLTDSGYIKKIKQWEGSSGFKYDSRDNSISMPENEMPKDAYDYYVFRLGTDSQSGENLYPNPEEMDQYRFLHEVNHVYQDYLVNEDGPERWYNRAIDGEINSSYANLFRFCYEMRTQNPGIGLTPWGNQEDYNSIENQNSQLATRAIEDANELVTMYLWSPEYFQTYMEYLSLEIDGYGQSSLDKDRLITFPTASKEQLSRTVSTYVQEMKEAITY